MQGYTDTILKYAADDTRTGMLENAHGIGEVGLTGTEVGKRLAVRFTLTTQSSQIDKIRFQVFGCGFTIAACAAVAEIAEGLTLADAARLNSGVINKRLKGLPEERNYCAELATEALQAAVKSVDKHSAPVSLSFSSGTVIADHGARIREDDSLYRELLNSAAATDLSDEDQQMFAGVLTVAGQENLPLEQTLGMDEDSLSTLFDLYFPGFDRSALIVDPTSDTTPSFEVSQDVLVLLLSHVPCDATGGMYQTSEWLARIIAARAARPGHLWTAMGFFKRQQLSEAIRRHLPTLAKANSQGMRWKRYLFKRVCDMNGGVMCKSPNCGSCSDYSLCFAPDEN